jgi:hypothetical protein
MRVYIKICGPLPQYGVLIETPYQVWSQKNSLAKYVPPLFEWRFSWFMDHVMRNLSAMIDTEPYGF